MAGIAEQLKKKKKATASSFASFLITAKNVISLEPFGFGMKSYGKNDGLCWKLDA